MTTRLWLLLVAGKALFLLALLLICCLSGCTAPVVVAHDGGAATVHLAWWLYPVLALAFMRWMARP